MNLEDEITLGMLQAIESNSHVSQRNLAQGLGIALGLTNAYLRRCVRKGLVKIKQAPVRRYAYYLTARGFAEKSRLAAEYLSVSLDFFKRARRECTALFAYLSRARWSRVVLIGAGELAEVAMLSAAEAGIEIVAVVDPARAGQRCAGRPVVASLAGIDAFDAVVVMSVMDLQQQLQLVLPQVPKLGLAPERLIALDPLQLRWHAVGSISQA